MHSTSRPALPCPGLPRLVLSRPLPRPPSRSLHPPLVSRPAFDPLLPRPLMTPSLCVDLQLRACSPCEGSRRAPRRDGSHVPNRTREGPARTSCRTWSTAPARSTSDSAALNRVTSPLVLAASKQVGPRLHDACVRSADLSVHPACPRLSSGPSSTGVSGREASHRRLAPDGKAGAGHPPPPRCSSEPQLFGGAPRPRPPQSPTPPPPSAPCLCQRRAMNLSTPPLQDLESHSVQRFLSASSSPSCLLFVLCFSLPLESAVRPRRLTLASLWLGGYCLSPNRIGQAGPGQRHKGDCTALRTTSRHLGVSSY